MASALLVTPVLVSGGPPATASPRASFATGQASPAAPRPGQPLAPTGDCTPPNCLYGQWPVGAWRPYSPDSAFNHKLTDAIVEDRVDSPGIVSDLATIHRVNTGPRTVDPNRRAPGNLGARVDGEDGWPTYYTSASDPHSRTVRITCDPTATDDTFSTGGCPPDGPGLYRQDLQVPVGAKPNGGVPVDGSDPAQADRHMTIIDQSAQPSREYDFWKVSPYGGPAGSPPAMTVAGMGWEPVNSGAGVTQAAPGNATAAWFGNLAGRIRAEELNAAILNANDPTLGVIPHAITISVECHDGQFSPPAMSAPAAGKCDAGRAAPMGARLYLPSSIAINPAWHPWQKVLLRTIQQYGMYINDTGAGGVLFNMQKEGGLQYLAENAPDNWWYAATGTHDLTLANNPPAVDTACKAHGWQAFGDGTKVLGCAAHFDVNSTNQVPLSIWTQLRVAALTVDRALRPATGPAAGGQSVTLHGTGFRGAVRVSFGAAATVTGTASQDGTTVTVVPPAHSPGAVDVTVSTDVVGQAQPAAVTLPAAYRYTDNERWQRLPGTAREVGVGADGTAWSIGDPAVAGGFRIYRWTGTAWASVPGGAVRVAVGPTGQPWIVTSNGSVFRRVGAAWQRVPGSAREVGVGADGTTWAIGRTAVSGGFRIYRWTGTAWASVPGGAVRVAVGAAGQPWIVTSIGSVFRRVGAAWQRVPGSAREVGVGADGTTWAIGPTAVAGGFRIYRWTGTAWATVPGGAVRVAVGPAGRAWIVASNGAIFRRVASSLSVEAQQAPARSTARSQHG